ncbi:MAG: FAD-dependent oxidoreductase [Sandaracinaceae bacterium]
MQHDIVIVGAGCAGLSLAWQLAKRGPQGRRVVLVDPRTEHTRDRTWCFWNVAPHDFEDLVSHRWAAWRVREKNGTWVTRTSPGRRYERLEADRFYDRVRGRLAEEPGIELRLGVTARHIHDAGDRVIVDTSEGTIAASMAFDSRPPLPRGAAIPGRDVSLLQHFEGWEVETSEPIFEPAVATLMDFDHPPQPSDGLAFTYVLPTSPTRALVEVTWFSAEVLPNDVYASHLEAWLADRGVAEWNVRHRERGVLPMRADSFAIRPSKRIHRIGLAGGAAKPSTGYAFQAIQRQSRRLAAKLERDLVPATVPPRDRVPSAQDAVFLSYLARDPERGRRALVRLFDRVEPDLLIRFLSDAASPAETLEVMAAMPAKQMLAEAIRSSRLIRRAIGRIGVVDQIDARDP